MRVDKYNMEYQKGFSLVEVMVALFVLAIGILGIIGLQLTAKQNNYDAMQRATATALASSIVERMRANSAAVGSYVSTQVPVANNTGMPGTCTIGVRCNAQELAAHDLQAWYSHLVGTTEQDENNANTGGLINPSACITRLSANEYRVAIAWRGRTALANPTISDCGAGTIAQLYGENDAFRRIFVIDARIE